MVSSVCICFHLETSPDCQKRSPSLIVREKADTAHDKISGFQAATGRQQWSAKLRSNGDRTRHGHVIEEHHDGRTYYNDNDIFMPLMMLNRRSFYINGPIYYVVWSIKQHIMRISFLLLFNKNRTEWSEFMYTLSPCSVEIYLAIWRQTLRVLVLLLSCFWLCKISSMHLGLTAKTAWAATRIILCLKKGDIHFSHWRISQQNQEYIQMVVEERNIYRRNSTTTMLHVFEWIERASHQLLVFVSSTSFQHAFTELRAVRQVRWSQRLDLHCLFPSRKTAGY